MQWLSQDISIGANLRKFRKQMKLTQSDVATKLNLLGSSMSCDTYSIIERGVRNIKVRDFIALKIIFNVDSAEFFDGLMPEDI